MLTTADIPIILFLVFLEGILSIDNALVLALLAKPLPREQQRKALTYGLIGAVVFRLIALLLATSLMKWNWVKFLGGGYLLWVALQHFFVDKKDDEHKEGGKKVGFWRVVIAIELTDIAFAVDSILAAVAVTKKFWVVFIGGVLGIIMMRFAATIFLRVLRRFPSFETTAYLLVFVIGSKLILEGTRLTYADGTPIFDFHHASSPAFWAFWGTMLACILYGFKPGKRSAIVETAEALEREEQAAKKL